MKMDPHAAAILKPEKRRAPRREKGRARAADVPHYGYGDPKTGWKGEVLRIQNPIQPSVILLTWCSTCREYMLEGSYQLRFCRSCGTPHPLPPGLPG